MIVPGGAPGGVSHPSELLASYLLGALEDRETAAVDAHLAGCDECQEEIAHLRLAVDALPLAVAPAAPPAAARAALLDRVRTGGDRPRAVESFGEEPPVPLLRTRVRRPSRTSPPPPRTVAPVPAWVVAIAACAVAAFYGWQANGARRDLAGLRQEIASASTQGREQVQVLASFDPSTTRLLAVEGAEAAPAVKGRLVMDGRTRSALLVLEGLPPPETGKTYQLWLLQSPAPTSAGFVRVDENGIATFVIQAPATVSTYRGIGVTVEPDRGSPAPTGPLVARADF